MHHYINPISSHISNTEESEETMLRPYTGPGTVTRALNLGTQEAEAVDVHEFKESLIYKASSRSAKAK